MAEPVDATRALTPPVIDIVDSKIHSLSREFRDRKFWMERHFKRIPLSTHFVSEWDIAKGLTTLAAVCGTVTVSSLSGIFLTRPNEVNIITQPPVMLGSQGRIEVAQAQITEAAKPAKKSLSQLLFDGFSKEKIIKYRNKIQEEAKIFIPTSVHEQVRIAGTNLWSALTDSVASDPLLNIPPEQQEAWAKLLRTIIFVESGGNRFAKSSTGAQGLAQVEKDSAQKAASRLGMTEYDVFDPETNLKLASRILQRNLYLFNGDLEFALAAYNFGENAIAGALKTYYITVQNMPMGKVQEDFDLMGRHGDSDPASRVYLKEHPVTYEQLFLDKETSPIITGYLKSVWGINEDELNFNTRVYLSAQSLFPNEVNSILNQGQTKV